MGGNFRVGQWLVAPELNTIQSEGRTIRLEPKVMEVLVHLAGHAGEVVPKDQIMRAIWVDTFVTDDVLTRSISELRRAFEDDPKEPRVIQTISKRGYRLIAPVDGFSGPAGATAASPGFTDRAAPRVPASEQSTLLRTQAGGLRYQRWFGGLVLAVVLGLLVEAWHGQLFDRARPGRIQSVAVLPLENLSHDPQQEYFADGMTDELITNLAKIAALRVISRTSVMRYKGTRKPLKEIASELNVDAVVEGTVLRSGGRVRITAQLIEAVTDQHVWAETYTRDLHDIMGLQDEVAHAIAQEIKVKLTPQEQARFISARPVKPEVYEAYLEGRFYWNKRTEEAVKKAIEYFNKAIEKDGNYALAYAGLADSYVVLGDHAHMPPSAAFPKAKAAALKALEIDDTLAEAHTSLAGVKSDFEWDWPGAELEFKRAIELNPNYSTAHHWHAINLERLRRLDEAAAELNRAKQLDPLSLIIRVAWVEELYMARRYDRAIEQGKEVLEMYPDYPQAHILLGAAYQQKGKWAEAFAEFQKARALGNAVDSLRPLGYAYAVSGRKREARQLLEGLKELSKERYVPAINLAVIYAGLGEKDQAFAWLEKAYAERDDDLPLLEVDPEFESLRGDPRFHDLVRRIGSFSYTAVGSKP